jgi:hypothetical protein
MPRSQRLIEAMGGTLKRTAAALRDAGVPYVLGGGAAAWVRGGPPTDHDLDFLVRPQDADDALGALADAGMRAERPPEEWLYKAWDGDVLVDLIFRPTGLDVDDALVARSPRMSVLSVTMPVLPLEDLISSKLLACREHLLDYEQLLAIARPLREQIDWDEVRRRTAHWPYAVAFMTLVEELDIAPRAAARPQPIPLAQRSG